ncbi:unnamed protein product [Laminaria digitata]
MARIYLKYRDSEGGIVKTYARDSVTNQTWTVAGSRVLCDKLSNALNFMLSEPTNEEREEFEAKRGGPRSAMLLVTKTWIGEGGHEQKKTFLLDKKPNTLQGRKIMWFGVKDVTPEVRKRGHSSAKEIHVAGCQTIRKTASTDTPGVLVTYTLSGFCPERLAGRPENCPLIRQGIMTGPAEFARGDDEMFRLMQAELPFGSTALVRVDPSDYRGDVIVPVVIARKAPCQWSHEYSSDGMSTPKDTMVWVYGLSQAPEGGQVAAYLVPDELTTNEIRAVPLKSIAGLRQGLLGYMERLTQSTLSETCKTFVLSDDVIEDARSRIVLMSSDPSSAFSDFRPVALSDEDLTRAPVARRMFPIGTVVKKAFKAPVMGNGHREWRGTCPFEGKVVSVNTNRKSRRHRYKLEWEGDVNRLVLAGVESVVDEGYVERYQKKQ